MLLNYLVLAISTTIDSIGIGITYGIKKTRISFYGSLVLFFLSILISYLSIFLGSCIGNFLPNLLVNIIGCSILVIMGIWIIFQSFSTSKIYSMQESKKNAKTFHYNFFIKCLGITIKIIRDPTSSDLDSSNSIDLKEAFFLGLALSLDSLCIGIGSGIIGVNSFVFPLLVATFQLIFLKLGGIFSKKLTDNFNIPNNIWSIISGFILICMGFFKFIF